MMISWKQRSGSLRETIQTPPPEYLVNIDHCSRGKRIIHPGRAKGEIGEPDAGDGRERVAEREEGNCLHRNGLFKTPAV
jgi:hypothetical protein